MKLSEQKCEALIPIKGNSPFFADTLNSLDTSVRNGLSVCIVYSEVLESTLNLAKQILGHGNLRFIDANGMTLAQKLSFGVSTSASEYILRLDADDLILEGRIDKQIAFLESNPEFALVASRMNYIDSDGQFVGVSEAYSCEPEQLLKIGCLIGHPSVMMRRSQILEAGNYQEFSVVAGTSIAEDYYLWVRVLAKDKICIQDEPLTEYRIHPNQISQKFELQRQAASLLIRGRLILARTQSTVPNVELAWESPLLTQLFFELNGKANPEANLWCLDYAHFVIRSQIIESALVQISKYMVLRNLLFFSKSLVTFVKLNRHRSSFVENILSVGI